jgi:hypothetical protein
LTTHFAIVNKAINARNHGAAGIILVNDTANHPGEPDQLIKFGGLAGPEDLAIPDLLVKAGVADGWLKPSGENLAQLSQPSVRIFLITHSHSIPTSSWRSPSTWSASGAPKRMWWGFFRVPTPVSPQCIVIGAHYDHLGLGDQHSLAPSQIGQIHHGADDNASGTSAVLEIADYLAHRELRPRHSIVFVIFAGEELGLLGASYYAEHPAIPMASMMAMINMDMVGRISGNRLYAGGTGTSPRFQRLVETANPSDHAAHFEPSYSASGYGANDHTSFKVFPCSFSSPGCTLTITSLRTLGTRSALTARV